jgi:hypothetical protein
MRRTYISPEFNYNRVFGTFNMREESSFFGSKMLEIEDDILSHNQGIIYYQNSANEQIDLSIEDSFTPVVYSADNDKKINHTLSIDGKQTDSQRNTQTRYILDINIKKILSNIIFANLKQARTFEGVRNTMCVTGDVNTSIKEYIDKNILDRYFFEKIDIFLNYKDLRSQNIRRFENNWSTEIDEISQDRFKMLNFQIDKQFDDSSIRVTFNQKESSQFSSFDYYFKLFWKKI